MTGPATWTPRSRSRPVAPLARLRRPPCAVGQQAQLSPASSALPRRSLGHVAGRLLGRPVTLLPGWNALPKAAQSLYTYVLGCHVSHALDFAAALGFYLVVWPRALPHAKEVDLSLGGWVSMVVGYNLACMLLLVGYWHWMWYADQWKDKATGPLAPRKFNAQTPYGPTEQREEGHLQREVLLTTLGWLQSAALQCVALTCYARGLIGNLEHPEFLAPGPLLSRHNLWNVASVLFISYWREIHFYAVHRLEHPWVQGVALSDAPWWDLGAVLYLHAHSWHHKSRNPGPWSGMSMHPIEHFIYFSCAWFCFVPALQLHPMHFLYCCYHCNIAPIGGHDGYRTPGGDSDYHYLHHAFFEVNYGVPFPIDFDRMFGTWMEMAWVEKSAVNGKPSLRRAKMLGKLLDSGMCEEAALAQLKKDDA